MKQIINSILPPGLLAALLVWFASPASAQSGFTNSIWTTTGNGNWRDLINWLGDVPTLASAVAITNAPTKTVTVNATTPTANLAARRIDLSAPPGSTNSLRLDNIGTTRFVLANTLSIESGGRIEIINSTLEMDGTLGGSFNLLAGELRLTGGSVITTNGAAMRIARSGVGSAEITGGQLLARGNLSVSSFSGSDGTLTISNGLVQVDGQMTVADDLGSVGRINVAGGTLVSTNLAASIGDDGNGTLTLTSGSVILPEVIVGNAGIGLVMVKDGSFSAIADTIVGELAGSDGTLTISNGLAHIGGQLTIGDNPGAIGGINVAGGTFIATNSTLTARIGDDGEGTMTVISGLVFMDDLSVGRSASSVGRLLIRGGVMQSGGLSVGRFAGSQGTLEVTGGELKLEASSLYIGREGNGTAVLSNGTVRTARTLVAAVSGASGSLQLSGGTIITGELIAANNDGQIQFNAGQLETRASTVANGAPFVVGDGMRAATLHLDGGTHSFADGLTISSNATLSGAGTILGTVTVLPGGRNQLGGTPPPPFTLTPLAGNGPFRFSFPSLVGQLYDVVSATNPTQAPWQLQATLAGNGATITFTNTAAGPKRFFRVIAR